MNRLYFILPDTHTITEVSPDDQQQIDFLIYNQGALGPYSIRMEAQAANDGKELHPAGTRDKIAALEAEQHAIWSVLAPAGYPVSDGLAQCVKAQEADVRVWMDLAEQYKRERVSLKAGLSTANAINIEREKQVATLTDDLHAAKNATQTAIARECKAQVEYNEAMTLVGKLYALLVSGAGEDSREVALANELIGIVPDSDVSDPAWGGVDALPVDDNVMLCPACGVAMDRSDHETMGYRFYICADHGVYERKESEYGSLAPLEGEYTHLLAHARDLVSSCTAVTVTDMPRVRIFSNGTQDMDWQAHNCEQCTKYSDDATACPLAEALLVACFDDGTVSHDIATRLGWKDETPPLYVWRCGEFERAEMGADEYENLPF